jgi:hypothetical protein
METILTEVGCSTGNNFPAPVLTENAGVIARADTGIVLAPALDFAGGHHAAQQPIKDVAAYLASRKPVAHYDAEPRLWIVVPETERGNIKELLAAFTRVKDRCKLWSVTRACEDVLALDRFAKRHWNAKTFRALFDEYNRTKDWVCLVNRSKCPVAWRKTSAGLPAAFLQFCAQRFGQFKREDGKRQALMSIKRQWRTGRNVAGDEEVIPGYEADWKQRNREVFPVGWHYSNITRQIKKSGLFTPGIRALLHDGESAARSVLPNILGTRKGLRFLELVTFDDVRTDWLVLDTATGQAVELWLLVARDSATAMVLGFVMHPATVREDGKATHLGARHMKQLGGWMLERYPLPPYVSTWKLERGTAGMDEAVRAALGELLGNRIAFSITSMIGAAASPAGYKEKAKGNSRGKASHESHNRLMHTQGAYISGQTGNRWDIRPADLNARTKEAVEIWQLAKHLPAHLRGAEQYPILTISQSREHLFRIFNEQNERTEHELEGFDEIVVRVGDKLTKRMQSPIERAAMLIQQVKGDWTPVNPAIVTTFYEHTEKLVVVKPNGEIEFQQDGQQNIFAPGETPLPPGTKALAYYLPDDPALVYLTDGKGCFLGIWARRNRVAFGDKDALASAMRYTHIAREAARAAANQLAAPERAELEAMRAHNAELMKLNEFTDVTPAPESRVEGRESKATVGAPIGAALTTVSATAKADVKRAKKKATAEATAAAADIFTAESKDEGRESKAETATDQSAAEELLAAFRSSATTGDK